MSEICVKFESASKILSKRWIGLIIHQLLDGPKRFNELESELKISGKVLSEKLKEMEKLSIVKRTVYPSTPVKIEYALTHKGKALDPVIKAIEDWSQSWI
ncbi:MarR family transcriptional regulator [Tenericutes bacterium MO-XQ]|jgi:DNA-binding HxlR family transcriptional regulator|nr:MarR family transcriptional regulator [Tenericutes bacterium MO-XQ]